MNDTRPWGHNGTPNWLFCDGHVKAVKPGNTMPPVNMWNITNTAAPTADLSTWLTNNSAQTTF